MPTKKKAAKRLRNPKKLGSIKPLNADSYRLTPLHGDAYKVLPVLPTTLKP